MKHTKPRFGSSICFGITVGLWLAGLMDLAYVEVGIAMLLTVTLMEKNRSHIFGSKDFVRGCIGNVLFLASM